MAAFLSTFRSNKTVDKWIENADIEEIHKNLTELFTKDNDAEGRGAAVTPAELSTLKKNHASTTNTLPEEVLSFYGGYPFQPASLPLSHDSLLRAVIALSGKDTAFGRKSSRKSPSSSEATVILRGRTHEDKVALLFRALAGASPTVEDVLDVLALVQPRPNPTRAPLGREELRPMAVRLAGKSDTTQIGDLRIPKEKLVAFMKAVGLEEQVVEDNISFEKFGEIVELTPGFFEHVALSTEVYLK